MTKARGEIKGVGTRVVGLGYVALTTPFISISIYIYIHTYIYLISLISTFTVLLRPAGLVAVRANPRPHQLCTQRCKAQEQQPLGRQLCSLPKTGSFTLGGSILTLDSS